MQPTQLVSPLQSIPLPGPIPDIPLPDVGIPDWANPFVWLNDQLKDAANQAIEKLQDLLMAIYGQSTNYWANMLYGEALGVAPLIALAVMYFLLAMFVVRRRYGKPFLEALMISIAIGAFGGWWFWIIDNIIRANIELTRIIKGMYDRLPRASGGTGEIELPEVVNTVVSIAAFASIALLAATLVIIFLVFFIEVMLAKLFGLIVLALYPLGRRSKQLWNALVASTLVAVFLGPFLVFATVEGIIWITNNGPGREENFIQSFYIIGGLLVANIGVVVLLILAYIKTDEVAGNVHSKIHGDVNADARLKEKVKTADVTQQSLNSMRVPAPIGTSSSVKAASEQPMYVPPGSKPVAGSAGPQGPAGAPSTAGTAATAAASKSVPVVAAASVAQSELARRREIARQNGTSGSSSRPPEPRPPNPPKTS